MAETKAFWRSPSGRIHGMRTCSGGAPSKVMRRVTLTREEFDALEGKSVSDDRPGLMVRCRCARWSPSRYDDPRTRGRR